ncbi:hypothetical protein LZ31DRAFT_57366 [Colletotrichum somersetense]|nr:hypothetical protein LZ31DRAFT_57366 [Colletotrichum somersetense]
MKRGTSSWHIVYQDFSVFLECCTERRVDNASADGEDGSASERFPRSKKPGRICSVCGTGDCTVLTCLTVSSAGGFSSIRTFYDLCMYADERQATTPWRQPRSRCERWELAATCRHHIRVARGGRGYLGPVRYGSDFLDYCVGRLWESVRRQGKS